MTPARAREAFAFALPFSLLLLSTPCVADTVFCDGFQVEKNEPLVFDASGTFITRDTQQGGDPANDGLPGGAASCHLGNSGDSWEFRIEHVAASWSLAGVVDGAIGLAGKHQSVHDDESTNELTKDGQAFGTQASRFFLSAVHNWDFGTSRHLSISETKDHGNHTDTFSFDALNVEAIMHNGALDNALSSGTKVHAQHDSTKKETTEQTGKGLGTNSVSPLSFVSYDATLQVLLFSVGPIDTLDSFGGGSGAIEPAYLDDPVTAASWSVSPLSLEGQLSNGTFQFGGGTVTLVDPEGKFGLAAQFGRYLVSDTTPHLPLTSAASLDEVVIDDVGDPLDGPSIFLADFVETNMFGAGIPAPERTFVHGMSFTFTTDLDLVALTNGFTQSASNVPARFVIAASRHELAGNGLPALSWPGLVTLAALLTAAGAVATIRRRPARGVPLSSR